MLVFESVKNDRFEFYECVLTLDLVAVVCSRTIYCIGKSKGSRSLLQRPVKKAFIVNVPLCGFFFSYCGAELLATKHELNIDQTPWHFHTPFLTKLYPFLHLIILSSTKAAFESCHLLL